MKNKYSLPKLLKKLGLSRNSYYYQEKSIAADDKYANVRIEIVRLFLANRSIYGYRKIHLLLRNEGIIISEKEVRRIMKQEKLIVKQRRKHKCNSYKGEITPAVDNVVNSDFHAEKPNVKWLTDITEFSIKTGKVYLSPMLDCLDGMPVSLLCYNFSLAQQFFEHLKTEMFYGHNWDEYTIDEFIQEVDKYMHWYRRDPIKSTLGGLSPQDYRRSIGVSKKSLHPQIKFVN